MNVKYDVGVQATEDYYAGRPCPYKEGTARADLWHLMIEEWTEEDARKAETSGGSQGNEE